eukprot:CAMPEP_0202406578 /NCGR_PEP_ID=MMETSP1128-20130828/9779_1 /ASSEMBLY_ACC=CAM_ASM_000463 /TAXON_ID=3047 /ORGANISM="Dunaliella tertiolecta, Strain CCMP1320" /LENGTH=117 /DNA_ID=CAMNT_0049011427 /DNA_START=722 /DNA_END=1076 /DNA_ORIENTATION=+
MDGQLCAAQLGKRAAVLNTVYEATGGEADRGLEVLQGSWVRALHEGCAVQQAHKRASHSIQSSHLVVPPPHQVVCVVVVGLKRKAALASSQDVAASCTLVRLSQSSAKRPLLMQRAM